VYYKSSTGSDVVTITHAALGTSWTYVAYQVLQLHNIAELIERTILRDGFFCFMSQLLFNL